MLLLLSDKAIVVTAAIKGVAMAFIITVIANADFIQGLATAIASACVSGTFLLVSIRMTNRRTEEKAQEVKKEIIQKVEENS